MKSILTIFLLLIIHSVSGMEMLTQNESACFQSFDASPLKFQAYKKLSKEDQDVLKNGTKYSEHPEEVKTAIEHYATNFCDIAQEAQQLLAYDVNFLSDTLLKMRIAIQSKSTPVPTDCTTARMYVWSSLLTQEERNALSGDSYLKDPETARGVLKKSGQLLAEELVKLELIENTDEAKKLAAKQYVDKKIEEYKTVYNS